MKGDPEMAILGMFREVWAIDFEFVAEPGCPPDVVCMVAREVESDRLIRLWRNDFKPDPPFNIGNRRPRVMRCQPRRMRRQPSHENSLNSCAVGELRCAAC